MMITALLLTLLLSPPTPAEVTVVQYPAKGKASLSMGARSKAEVERRGTVTQVSLEFDGLPHPQTVVAGMNCYVVWAVSPEGSFDNLGELDLSGTKGVLEATTAFDRFALLVTTEPHYMVDKPGSRIVYKNGAPRDLTSNPVMIEVGAYAYPELQANAVGVPGLVMEARAALAIATAAQAAVRAEAELRQARIAMETMEELFRRGSAPDVVSAAAHAAIRSAQIATTAARQSAR
jgi:hypothetical protein